MGFQPIHYQFRLEVLGCLLTMSRCLYGFSGIILIIRRSNQLTVVLNLEFRMTQQSQYKNTIRTLMSTVASLTLFLTTIFLTTSSYATNSQTTPTVFAIEPYSLTYEVSASNVPFKSEAHQILKVLDSGEFHLSMSAKAMFTKVEEEARFLWQQPCQAIPKHYAYTRKGIGRNKNKSVEFDWKKRHAAFKNRNSSGKHPISEGITDKLSEQLAIQCNIAAGKKAFTIDIFDDDSIRSHQFEVVGEELLDNPFFGEINTLKVMRVRENNDKRVTSFWIAPSLNYRLVRFLQQKESGDHYQLQLKAVE